jgi:hypothetical protein
MEQPELLVSGVREKRELSVLFSRIFPRDFTSFSEKNGCH